MSTTSPNILTQIYTGAVKIWDDIESTVETDIAKVEAVLPGAAPIIADIKQTASNAFGVVVSAEETYEPTLVTGLESLADTALTKYTGGLALPLVGVTNAGIQKIANDGQAWFQAWALKVQADLAENNAAQQGGTSAPTTTVSSVGAAYVSPPTVTISSGTASSLPQPTEP